jgi:3-deoxy-D-manno-octulosonic-acid transferase
MPSAPKTFGLRTYRRLAACTHPLINALLKRRIAQGKEDPARVSEKQGKPSALRPEGPLIWLHGASVGEALSMLPLIDTLSSVRPDLQFLVTTGTLTSAQLMAERLPATARHQFSPLDHPAYWERFYEHWHPDLGVIIESELWPNMIMCARDYDVPLVLANARLSEKSTRGWARVKKSIAHLLGNFQLVLAQDSGSAGRLKDLGVERVSVPGNLKMDAGPLVADASDFEALSTQIGGRPCWVAASTHDGEEALVARIHAALKHNFPDLLTILAPRHPARGASIADELATQEIDVAQRSTGDAISATTDIYLADTLGEMGLVFSLAPIAFVGGSFVNVGGHNPLEAARLNSAILFGAYMYNFTDAARELVDAEAARQVQSESELLDVLSHWLSTPAVTAEMAVRGKEAVAVSTGVAERVTQELLSLLPHDDPKVEGEDA